MTTSSGPRSTPGKMWGTLTAAQRRGAAGLLALMSIGMVLETLGAGLVLPTIAILTQPDFATRYTFLEPVMRALGDPGPQELVLAGMWTLAVVYLIKALFLAFLAWRQMRFVAGVQVELSQRLFTTYLRQPYTFHLQHNSAQLIRNVTGEVSIFVYQA